MPLTLLLGAAILGGGAVLAGRSRKKPTIQEAAEEPAAELVALRDVCDGEGDGRVSTPLSAESRRRSGTGPAAGAEPALHGNGELAATASSAGDIVFTGCVTRRDQPRLLPANAASKACVQLAIRRSELLCSLGCEDSPSAEVELIAGGRPSEVFSGGLGSVVHDVVVAAWLYEERPPLPKGSTVMSLLPQSTSAHLFIVAASLKGWTYVFEKWRGGVYVARFRDPDAARACRAGFAGRFRRRKLVRQLACVAPPANTSPARPLRVPDLLLWSAAHSEFRQYTDNCHTFAVNLSLHLGMRPPKAAWEGLLYNAY
ncbi:hypothetical protein DIPPA_19901 [Diplonema papillatum]|nr:hypothetical protein DIPPA_19901 [Diplonema papillatum]